MKPKNVIIGSIAERSSFNAAIVIASLFAKNGHNVSFVGNAENEFKEHIEKQGFVYVVLGSKSQREITTNKLITTRNPIAVWKLVKNLRSYMLSSMEAFVEDNEGKVDLAFLDVNATFPASLFLSKLKIPTIVFLPNYASRFSLRYPPIYVSKPIIKDGDALSWWQVFLHLLAWSYQRFKRQIIEPGFLSPSRLLTILTVRLLFPLSKFRRQAERNGWQFCYGEWGPRPKLPEIVIGHKALDWEPLRQCNARFYVATSFPRMEFSKDWCLDVDPNKPLIYCNMSTLFRKESVFTSRGDLRRHARIFKRYLDVVISSVGTRPDWQLLVACGPFAEAFDRGSIPENVRVCDRALQIEVLERAALAITQAGAGTMRECAFFGVPMLAFPMWADQYGNAARIQHFKMGLNGGNFRKLNARKLVNLIDQLLRDKAIASSVSEFKKHHGTDSNIDEWPGLRAFIEQHTGLSL
jgi:zeaxanthin glucosyltransferase